MQKKCGDDSAFGFYATTTSERVEQKSRDLGDFFITLRIHRLFMQDRLCMADCSEKPPGSRAPTYMPLMALSFDRCLV